MGDDPLLQRMQASALSLWELGDLLGIHPHHLHRYDISGGLLGQPVRVVIELAQRLDMHPADLVPALGPVLANRRTPTVARPAVALDGDVDLDVDALVVLTALASTSVPLNVEELATALTWTLDRTASALGHAADQHHLGGPVSLRRVPPDAWTVTARRDLLSADQQRNVTEAAGYRGPLTVDEANVLLAAHVFGHTPSYRTWRSDHLDAEHTLKDKGLLTCRNSPHHAGPSPDVRFSLIGYE